MNKKNRSKTGKTKSTFNRRVPILMAIMGVLLLVFVLFLLQKSSRTSLDSRSDAAETIQEQVRTWGPTGVASQPFSPAGSPISIYPTSGNWNKTPSFIIKNISKTAITFKYLLDCWDEQYCKDETGTKTLQAGASVTIGLGEQCSKWQLDLNISGQPGWDWGAIVEVMKECPALTPTPTTGQTSCRTPLKKLGGAGAKTLTVWERTSTTRTFTLDLSSTMLNIGTVDHTTAAQESYDLYLSNPDGTANTDGTALTISMKRRTVGKDNNSGNNIDAAVITDKTTGKTFAASSVSSKKRGTSLSAKFNDFAENALGFSDGKYTHLGDPESRLTVCFD